MNHPEFNKLQSSVRSEAVKSNSLQAQVKTAFDHHRAGDLMTAARLYDDILEINPNHSDALQLSAMILSDSGAAEAASARYDHAINLAPNSAFIHNNRGVNLKRMKRFEEAILSFERALVLKPDYVQAQVNRGDTLRGMGRLDDARLSYEAALSDSPTDKTILRKLARVIRDLGFSEEALRLLQTQALQELDSADELMQLSELLQDTENYEAALEALSRILRREPNNAMCHFKSGILRHLLNRPFEALDSFHTAISLKPDWTEAYNNISVVLCSIERADEAIAVLNAALSIGEGSSEIYFNRGKALQQAKRYEDAIESYSLAISLDNKNAELHNNKGTALHRLNQFEEAICDYEKALELAPNYVKSWNNKGLALQDLFKFDDALINFNRATDIDPEYAEAYWNQALLHLLRGDYVEGWKLYEWRLRMEDAAKKFPSFDKPSWRGTEDISDKRLLIAVEQGLGDFIQFCRYVPLLLGRTSEVILEVPKILAPLIETLHPDITLAIKGETLPEFDVYCPLMSLPFVFGTTLESIPSNERYLQSDPKKVALWRERLGASARPRVGLVWSGSPTSKNDHNRSIALSDLVPVLGADYEWHSLQKEYRDADFEVLQQAQHIHQHQDDLHDFSDTAALMENLDFVITVDTSVAHLAGALGKEVWVLLPKVPDFRWLLDREDSPWYASAKLIRQDDQGEWGSVLATLG